MVQTATEEAKEKETDCEGRLAHFLVSKRDQEADQAWKDDWEHANWRPSWVKKVGSTTEDNGSDHDSDFVERKNIGLLMFLVAKLLIEEQGHPE